MGVLGWRPSEFWGATPWDLLAALDGWKEKHGTKKDSGDAMTKDEFEELRDKMGDK